MQTFNWTIFPMIALSFIWCSLLAGGCYWGFHRGKPVPFANRAPSWIFEARAPGYERASANFEGGGRVREENNRRFFSPLPAPLPSLTLSTLYPAQTWPREFKMATSLRIPVFFDHPTACVQATFDGKMVNVCVCIPISTSTLSGTT